MARQVRQQHPAGRPTTGSNLPGQLMPAGGQIGSAVGRLSVPGDSVAAMGKTAAGVLYECSECGWQSPKWAGRCGECQAWGTVAEARRQSRPGWPALGGAGRGGLARSGALSRPGDPGGLVACIPATRIGQVDAEPARARPTGLGELDRVLGGGLVPGAVILLAGEPGIGKSTLLLQAGALAAASGTVLYVTGEESAAQVRLRADRVGAVSDNLYLAAETDLGVVAEHIESVDPALLIVDSVQTMSAPGIDSAPGGVAQVREITSLLTALAKQRTLTTILVGHVTKDGSVAGPRSVEHLVDVVLHFEGDSRHQLRMVRALKNRFGPTDEFGCFELGEDGLTGLADPGRLFLSRMRVPVPGTCVTVALEGRRPLVAEVQTLVCASAAEVPRRVNSGLDSSRVGLVTAVLQRRAGIQLGRQDIYAATVGGVRLTEPAIDLAVALALASARSDLGVPGDLVAIGEVGLAGEVRGVPGVARRLAEAERMGFRRALVPPGCLPADGTAQPGWPGARDAAGHGGRIEVIAVADIAEAIAAGLGGPARPGGHGPSRAPGRGRQDPAANGRPPIHLA